MPNGEGKPADTCRYETAEGSNDAYGIFHALAELFNLTINEIYGGIAIELLRDGETLRAQGNPFLSSELWFVRKSRVDEINDIDERKNDADYNKWLVEGLKKGVDVYLGWCTDKHLFSIPSFDSVDELKMKVQLAGHAV